GRWADGGGGVGPGAEAAGGPSVRSASASAVHADTSRTSRTCRCASRAGATVAPECGLYHDLSWIDQGARDRAGAWAGAAAVPGGTGCARDGRGFRPDGIRGWGVVRSLGP